MQIKITARLISGLKPNDVGGSTKTGNELMLSACGEWLTNGHWLLRKSHVVANYKTITSEWRPPADALIAQSHLAPKPSTPDLERTLARYGDMELLATPEGQPVCFVHREYLDMIGDDFTWRQFENDPHNVIGIYDQDTLIGAVMPITPPAKTTGLQAFAVYFQRDSKA